MNTYLPMAKCFCANEKCRRFLSKIVTSSEIPLIIIKCERCSQNNLIQIVQGKLKMKATKQAEPSGDLQADYIEESLIGALEVDLYANREP